MGSKCQPLVQPGGSYLVTDPPQTDRQTSCSWVQSWSVAHGAEQGSHPAPSYSPCIGTGTELSTGQLRNRGTSASGHFIPETSTQAAPVPWLLSEADRLLFSLPSDRKSKGSVLSWFTQWWVVNSRGDLHCFFLLNVALLVVFRLKLQSLQPGWGQRGGFHALCSTAGQVAGWQCYLPLWQEVTFPQCCYRKAPAPQAWHSILGG